LKYLSKLSLIKIHKDLTRPSYEANYRNKFFLNIKRERLLDELFMSNLPQFLNELLGETGVILFGSCFRGDYYEDSDIDIFIQHKKININVKEFEKILNRKINLFFESKWQNLNEGMKTGLLNDGISINGRLKI
jgi:predicted nucleotidyltransferase